MGDEVVTTGGIYGVIKAQTDRVVTLQVDDGVRLRFDRAAIARLPRKKTLRLPNSPASRPNNQPRLLCSPFSEGAVLLSFPHPSRLFPCPPGNAPSSFLAVLPPSVFHFGITVTPAKPKL